MIQISVSEATSHTTSHTPSHTILFNLLSNRCVCVGGVCVFSCRWSACAAGSTSPKEPASAPWWARSTRPIASPRTPTGSTSGGWVYTHTHTHTHTDTHRHTCTHTSSEAGGTPSCDVTSVSRVSGTGSWARCFFFFVFFLFFFSVCCVRKRNGGCDVIVWKTCHTVVPVNPHTHTHTHTHTALQITIHHYR